jgi:hypothetical protein
MVRRFAIALAMVLAVIGGVASASVVTDGAGAGPANGPVQPEEQAVSETRGSPVADPRGGPPWAVRVLDGDSDRRCIMVGRTDGRAFGPVDADGRVVETEAIIRGSCADPAADPLQLAIAMYPASAGQGARTVLFAIADAAVESVRVVGPDGPRATKLDAARTLAAVYDGLAPSGSWTVTATLRDGSTRVYRPGALDSVK